jgi:hypothetical protein
MISITSGGNAAFEKSFMASTGHRNVAWRGQLREEPAVPILSEAAGSELIS